MIIKPIGYFNRETEWKDCVGLVKEQDGWTFYWNWMSVIPDKALRAMPAEEFEARYRIINFEDVAKEREKLKDHFIDLENARAAA